MRVNCRKTELATDAFNWWGRLPEFLDVIEIKPVIQKKSTSILAIKRTDAETPNVTWLH